MAARGHFNEYGQCISRKSGLGKRTFLTKKDAKKAAKRLATNIAGTNILDVYRCPHCDYWHLGH